MTDAGKRRFARPMTLAAVVCSALALAAPAAGAAGSAGDGEAVSGPLRDQRYCELLPVHLSFAGPVATVYNTIGHGNCPQAEWAALTAAELRRTFGGITVIRNGPRYFIMDRIVGAGATAAGDSVELGGITLVRRAELTLPWSVLWAEREPWHEQTVERETVYRFDAGKPLFELTGPDGSTYVMQSYSRIVDPTLSYADLPGLGSRLKLPAGWSYRMRVPEADVVLSAGGRAVVLQDDLTNTYQKMQPARP